MKHFAANGMTLVIVACLAVAGAVAYGVEAFTGAGPLSAPTRIEVARGDGLGAVAERLDAAGAIESGAIFRIGARYRGAAEKLRFGEYEIPASASMAEILDIIVSGRSIQYPITVAEGLTSWEVVEQLRGATILEGEIAEIPAEGSLAPDTYNVARGADRQALLDRMRAAQTVLVDQAWAARDEDTPLGAKEELVTLASIVERETGIASERAHVASVFLNRLRRGMRLQSDPTIIYGLTEGEGPLGRPIRQSEISKRTPYNTYVIDGLPPGPIANPGAAALMAAARPDETDDLYFVADGTGGHAFAETLAEHRRNVRAWRAIEADRATQ